jgi:uncharacterized membrane protein
METEHPPLDHFFRRRAMLVGVLFFCAIVLVQLAFILYANRSSVNQTLAVQAAMTLRLAAQKDGNVNIDPATLPQWQVNPQLLVGCIVDKNNQLLASVGGSEVTQAPEVNRLCQEWSSVKGSEWRLFESMFSVSIQNQGGNSMGKLIMVGQVPLSWSSVLTVIFFSGVLTAVLLDAFFLLIKRLKNGFKNPSTI